MLELNLIGFNCPLPVLKAKKFLATIETGEQVKIITNDPASEKDLQIFCQKTGNILISQTIELDQIISIIARR